MGDGKLRRAAAWGVLVLAVVLLTSCGEGVGFTPTPENQPRMYPVDPTFKEFYQTLGGQQLLGPAISPLENRQNLRCQFVERALMCFDPAATDATRFGLYPLGRELGIKEESRLNNVMPSPGARVVDGFIVYEKFVPLYDQLFGSRYVGRPLTELRVNQDLQRVEQFFENVGFYQNLGDPNGPVFLVPYGAYLCGADCAYQLKDYWSIIKSSTAEQPFAPTIARLGGPAAFGSLLLKPQVGDDGNLQQVYTNAIFYAPQDDLTQVRLRPLPLLLGFEKQPLVQRVIHDQLVFYEIEGGLGHNVPLQFDTFIAQHGGRELSGNPISEVILVPEKNLYRQCFENYCLIYDPSASDIMRVQMEPLGKAYVNRFPPPEGLQLRNMFSPDHISLVVAADKPNLGEKEEQYVRLIVQQRDNGAPLERVEATLVLNIPNQQPVRYFIPPTDANGMSAVTIPAQPGVTNGTRLSYKVCLNLPSEQPICTSDSYLIWNTQ